MEQPQIRVVYYTELRPMEHVFANGDEPSVVVTTDPRYMKQVNIPICSDVITASKPLMLEEAEVQAIYAKWPASKGRLRMLFEGVVFMID